MSETTSSSPKEYSNNNNIKFPLNELFIKSSLEELNEEKVKKEEIEKPIIKYNYILKVKCFKWNHNYHNKYDSFFDYESKAYSIKEFNIDNNGGTIVDYFNSIQFFPKLIFEENSSFSSLINLNRFFLKENITITFNEKDFIIRTNKYTFLSCKYLEKKNELLNLRAGSELKIGKYILKIIGLKIENNIQIEKPLRINKEKEEELNNEAICKICLSNSNKKNLINICNCKGTMKYVHYECIFIWIQKKSITEYNYINPHISIISIKKFFCEICKKSFPIGIIDNDNNSKFLLNIDKKNFCILIKKFSPEFKNTKENFSENEYIIIDLSNSYKNNITIGRDKTNILQLNNISVSRNHCLLYLDEDKNIKIYDNKSKFGTLLQDKSVGSKLSFIKINNDNPNITLQKGNTVYNFSYIIS